MLRPILAVLLLAIPLYPKFPLLGVSNTYVAIRLDDILIAIALIFLLVNQIRNRFSLFKLEVSKTFIAYFIAITISFINAFFVFQTEPTNILLLHLLRRFEYMSLFFFTLAAVKSKDDFKWVYLFSLIASIGVAVYGYGQKFFQFPVISTMNEEFSKGQLLQMNVWTRISSTFAGHYDLAAYLSVILVIFGALIVLQKKILFKLPQILIWLVLYHILTLTASRVSTFTYLGGMVLALILIKKYLYIVPVLILFSFTLLNSKDLNQRLLATIPSLLSQFNNTQSTVVVPTLTPVPTAIPATISPTPIPVIVKTTPIPTPIRHQSEDIFIPPDIDAGVARSGEIRFNAEWPRAITAYTKSPLTGTGLGSITLATDNDYLRALGESGILGLLTFLTIFVYFTVRTFPYLRSKVRLPLVFFAASLVMLANATLIDVFEASKTAYLFWIMMAVYHQILQFYPPKK